MRKLYVRAKGSETTELFRYFEKRFDEEQLNFCIVPNKKKDQNSIIARYYLKRVVDGYQVPIYIDCRSIGKRYNRLMEEKPYTLFTFLIAKNICGNESDEFCIALEGELQRANSDGKREYLLFLDNFDRAIEPKIVAYDFEKYNSKMRNVQVVVISSREDVFRIEHTPNLRDKKTFEHLYYKPILYFDEVTNEVKGKIGFDFDRIIYLV